MQTTATSVSDSGNRIPIIDVSAYLAGKPGADRALAEAITRTCLDTGFLVISNHGVPQPIIDRAFAAAAAFFALDEANKFALKIGTENIGYLPYGGQTVRTSTVHRNTKPNFSESFYITTPDPDPALGEPDHDRNKWPPGMDEFKAAQVSYFQTMRALAHRMLPAFALALDLPANYFEDDFTGPSSTVRLIEYAPQLQDESDLFGFAPHTDGSFITFLPQSKFPGLEVRTASGEWIRPPAVPGTLVVNTGEMLAHYSNDRFVPTPHRVLNRSANTRHAMPFFYGPNRDKVISCVPTCVSEDNPARYTPSTSRERNAIKDRTNFPHRQTPEFASESY
ncbi:MAG: 2-oxoglutarate and iron-dependent oxygenase domain-containing protein [Acetobacteraceae bacterium]